MKFTTSACVNTLGVRWSPVAVEVALLVRVHAVDPWAQAHAVPDVVALMPQGQGPALPTLGGGGALSLVQSGRSIRFSTAKCLYDPEELVLCF